MQTDITEHAVWGPLVDWAVTFTSGDVLRVTAHAYEVRDDEYVFSILMRGSPGYYMTSSASRSDWSPQSKEARAPTPQ